MNAPRTVAAAFFLAGAAKTPPAPVRFAEHPDSETAAAPTAAEALTKSLRLRPFFVPFISAFIE
jgi:hypothetical protein